MRVALLANILSPYRVPVFRALAATQTVKMTMNRGTSTSEADSPTSPSCARTHFV